MQKKQFEKFSLNFLGESAPAFLPFTVASALFSAGVPMSDIEDSEGGGVTELRITARVTVDDSFLSAKYIYIRLSGLTLGARLYFNGNSLGFADSRSSLSTFSVKDYAVVGENTLEFVFSGSEKDLLFAGICGSVELLHFNTAIINNISVSERFDGARAIVDIKTDTLGSFESVRAVATLVSGAGQIYYGGLTRGRGSITVTDPLLWWPRGVGIQNLYKLTVNLYGDMEIEDTKEVRIGLCRFATANDQTSAELEVNGEPMLPMGAVYRENNELYPALRKKQTEAVIGSAVRSGFNTLVIPDGAALPDEDFYSMCDSYGIMVIHEIKQLTPELSDLLARRSYHPSISLFDVLSIGDGIDELCERIHGLYPDAEIRFTEKFTEYYGKNSFADTKTIYEMIPEGERNLFSAISERLLPDSKKLFIDISESYPYAKSLEDFAYLSGVDAARRVEEKMINARLASGKSGRAVYDGIEVNKNLSDKSSLDGKCRYKALQYRSSHFFSPITIYAEGDGATVGISVINSRRTELVGEIEFSVVDNKNNKLFSGRENCTVEEGKARKIFTADLSKYVSGYESERYLEYSIREGNTVLSRGVLLFVKPKHFSFQNPNITYELSGSGRRFSVTLTAESFSYLTKISFDGVDALLYDNFLNITSSAPVKLSFMLPEGISMTAGELSEKIQIKSMYDVIHQEK